MSFTIPPGDHNAEYDRYSNLMRCAHIQAGRRRQRFIAFKRAVKRCHIATVEPPELRELLSQVKNSKY